MKKNSLNVYFALLLLGLASSTANAEFLEMSLNGSVVLYEVNPGSSGVINEKIEVYDVKFTRSKGAREKKVNEHSGMARGSYRFTSDIMTKEKSLNLDLSWEIAPAVYCGIKKTITTAQLPYQQTFTGDNGCRAVIYMAEGSWDAMQQPTNPVPRNPRSPTDKRQIY